MTGIDHQAIEQVSTALILADPAALLPERRRDEAARIQRPLRVISAARIGDRPFYAVLLEDARGERYGGPMLIDDGRLRRARAEEGASRALIEQLRAHHDHGLKVTLHEPESWPQSSDWTEHAIAADQTNDLVAVGSQALVKWMLHPATGEDVASARLGALTAAGFSHAPRLWAEVDLVVTGGRESTASRIATVIDLVPDAQDGWEWAVSDVRELALGTVSMVQALAPVLEIGTVTAHMHIALSRSPQRRTATMDDVQNWLRWFEDDVQASGIEGDLVVEVRRALPSIEAAVNSIIMPIHGDYHIGQVLRSSHASTPDADRYVIVDFDGSPLLTPQERLLPQPPARDVASMLASLDHVGRVVLHRTEGLDQHQRSVVLQWIDRSQSVLLAAYLAELEQADALDLADARLTAAFQVQQELREYAYARRYLPHWHYVPDAALPALIARQRGGSDGS